MTMNENEIVRDFKEAKEKRKQISILADMNQCSREEIRGVLLRNGISEAELPSKPGRRRAVETEVFHQQVKKNHAKPEEFRPAKPEPVPMEETPEYPSPEPAAEKEEAEHIVVPEVRHEVPETVRQLCRDRIWGIAQEIGLLERERRELQKFLGEAEEMN